MRALITGGTGFLGEKLIEKLITEKADDLEHIRVIARNEGKLINMQQQFKDIEVMAGSVEDYCFVKKAIKNITHIFHLAGFKHVTWAEKQTAQCVNTNVIGTLNICQTGHDARYVIATSTDKAEKMTGVYGASKYIMERIFAEYNSLYPTKYRIVRYGNVFYSTGSVLCLWKDRLQKGKHIKISDRNVTRFFWTREQAVDLLFECLENAKDSTPYMPEMKSCSLGDLADAMMEKYGNYGYQETGLKEGENFHEQINGVSSEDADKWTKEELLKIV